LFEKEKEWCCRVAGKWRRRNGRRQPVRDPKVYTLEKGRVTVGNIQKITMWDATIFMIKNLAFDNPTLFNRYPPQFALVVLLILEYFSINLLISYGCILTVVHSKLITYAAMQLGSKTFWFL